MVPVVPLEIEVGIEHVDPAGVQLDDNLLITLPVELVNLKVIVSAACAAVARAIAANSAVAIKSVVFITNPEKITLPIHTKTDQQLKVVGCLVGGCLHERLIAFIVHAPGPAHVEPRLRVPVPALWPATVPVPAPCLALSLPGPPV